MTETKSVSELSEAARRKIAMGFRAEAGNPQWTAAERVEFARMADAWERTLKPPKTK